MMTCQLALRYCAKGDDNTAYLTESFDVSQSRTFPVKAQHSSDQRMGYWLLMGVSPNIGPQALLVSCTTCAIGFDARIPCTRCIASESPQTNFSGISLFLQAGDNGQSSVPVTHTPRFVLILLVHTGRQ